VYRMWLPGSGMETQMSNLNLDFIDTNQLHTLTKIASKNEAISYSEGKLITGYPAIGFDAKTSWVVVRRHLEAFMTSSIVKVEFKPDHVVLETLNSIYELRPVDGPRLDDREG